MDAAGREDIADILRLKRSAALRKESMLMLAREWRYKADMWQRGPAGPGANHRPSGARQLTISAPRQPAALQPLMLRPRQQPQAYAAPQDALAAATAAVSAVLQQHLAAVTQQQQAVQAPLNNAWLTAAFPMLFGVQQAQQMQVQAQALALAQAQAQAQAQAAQAHDHAWQLAALPSPLPVPTAALDAERASLCASMRRVAGETAVVWEQVAARVSAHAADTHPLQPNATAIHVTRWLRSVAAAHSAALVDEPHGSEEGQAADAAMSTLLRQVTETLTSTELTLGRARADALQAYMASPVGHRASWAAPTAAWLNACSRSLDQLVAWLAHTKSQGASQANRRASACCGAFIAALTEAFFGGAEEALTLRRQWYLLSESVPAGAPQAQEHSTESVAAVMAAVVTTMQQAGGAQ